MQNRRMLATSPAISPRISALIDFTNPRDTSGAGETRLRHAFATPRQIFQALRFEEVRSVLDCVEAAARQGAWCVGYLRYEAAPAFDAALAVRPADGPLAWFAVYDEALPWPGAEAHTDCTVEVEWLPGLERPIFDAALAQIHEAIAAGALYQLNFTTQIAGHMAPCDAPQAGLALFHALQRAQPGGYAAYLDAAGEQLLSVSPELFFDWRDGQLLTRPMKGTAPRGATPQDDAAQALALQNSPKERAENVMIVDLLRNDVSRISEPFSVQVPRLFHTQALPTVWQMTSDVTARTRTGCSLADVFGALFPCGSVTGAPKVQAMQAIRALESGARGVYCGALGVVQPGGTATFNVPIRTLTLQGTRLRYGVGSGITSGSMSDGEWSEWQHKQAYVQRASTRFDLLETLGLFDGQWHNRDAHLARMAQAAQHFAYPWSGPRMVEALDSLEQTHPTGSWRVRVLLNLQGQIQAQAYPLLDAPLRVTLRLAERAFEQAHSEFVRFKTTHRAHYEAFNPWQPEVFDTLLWNTSQEITECTRGNVALKLRGQWVTPPLRCGLLAGVGRAVALANARVVEAVVLLQDLPEVTEVAFINSLRDWIDADLCTLHTPCRA